MRLPKAVLIAFLLAVLSSCASPDERGIADTRSEFGKFLPIPHAVASYDLKPVKPFFKRANRAEILRAIDHACQGSKGGSSIYDERTGAGYYVNCNPRNRRLLNGYSPLDPKKRLREHD